VTFLFAGSDDLQMTFHDTSIWGDTVTTFNFTAMEELAASEGRTPRLLVSIYKYIFIMFSLIFKSPSFSVGCDNALKPWSELLRLYR